MSAKLMKQRTLQSEIGILEHVILKHARDAFLNQEKIDEQWRRLSYTDRVNFIPACKEYDSWSNLFLKDNIKIHWVAEDVQVSMDSIYVRDTSVLTDQGALLCRMGKEERAGEDQALRNAYESLNIPIIGQIESPGTLEGGDTVWLKPDLLAVGLSYRTNEHGINQLRDLCNKQFEIIEVDLPHYLGSKDVFHLMSIISPLTDRLLLIYPPLMPIRFRNFLLNQGFQYIEVPAEEFKSMGTNVLSLGPKRCIMLAGNPKTKSRIESYGIQVFEYGGHEISSKGMGGPTCLTRPLWRMI